MQMVTTLSVMYRYAPDTSTYVLCKEVLAKKTMQCQHCATPDDLLHL